MSRLRLHSCLLVLGALTLVPATAAADGPDEPYHPWMDMPTGPLTIDCSYEGRAETIAAHVHDMTVEQPDLAALDDAVLEAEPEPDPNHVGELPEGWVQRGSVVLPEPVALGLKEVDPDPVPAWEDIPGNEYPRKHTVYLNFQGGMLYSGKDNSAISKSSLAKQGIYPTFGGGTSTATAAAQAFAQDVSKYGIRVMYETRPSQLVSYTMVMVGGSWQDTNLEDPAGGVAPGADCEARGQRHVVYTFLNSGSISIANVSSQEAGHSWGLDHTTNCSSVMAYCGSGDKYFSTSCNTLCEAQCQGPNSAGCRPTHEKYCGVGSDQQNEDDELTFIFGGNEPDMDPPQVEVVQPADGDTFPVNSNVNLRATVSDNYGGVGWKLYLEHDGEVLYDEVDYYRELIDEQNRAALNATGLPAGTYVFRITAEDHADHVVSDEITFYVEGDGPPTTGTGGTTDTSGGTSSGGSDSGSTASSGGSDTDTGGSDSGLPTTTTTIGSSTDTSGENMGKDGCACSTDDGAPGWLGLTLLPLLGLRPGRRRRP